MDKQLKRCNVEEQLKPCPFCGGKAEGPNLYDGYAVSCADCGCRGEEVVYLEKAIAVWNRREVFPAEYLKPFEVVKRTDENIVISFVKVC